MNPIVDLHMHTTYSDGLKTPEELISFAKERKVNVMSINDHDNVNGVLSILSSQIDGINVIYGIEVSSTFENSTIHIACYFPRDTNFEELQKELTTVVNEKRITRAKIMIEKLQQGGIPITWEQLEKHCQTCLPSRPRIGEVLVENHVVDSVDEAFNKYLNKKSPYYVRGGYQSCEEAIHLIHRYNGIACLAHPWLYSDNDRVMEHFVSIGVDGMECFPPAHKIEADSEKYYEFAKKHNLLVTSGSDYHGSKVPEVLPGDNRYCQEEWERVEKVFKTKNIY